MASDGIQRRAGVNDAVLQAQPGDVIHQLHQELLAAQVRREESGLLPLFEVESLEIEMQVALSVSRGQGGKVDVRLIALTKDSKVDEHRIHTIRLKLRTVSDESSGTTSRSGARPSVKRRDKAAGSDA
ncbi:trypco2 family protein [Streptomyces sp. HUCO-GS316]|uniref:trypco2 family protein n=1 Tax=Streptomyces sp. HUCO-GS316 TaxID=2692198 RepID=UPI003FA6918B